MQHIVATLALSLIGVAGLALGLLDQPGPSRTGPASAKASSGDDRSWHEAEANAREAEKQRDRAIEDFRAAQNAARPKIDQPRRTPEQEKQAETKVRELKRIVTEKTMAATAARNRVENIRQERQAAQKPAGAADAGGAGTPRGTNPLRRIDVHLGKTYEHARKLEAELEGLRRLPFPPIRQKPEESTDPFDVADRRYQDMYDSGPRSEPIVAQPQPRPRPAAVQPRPEPPVAVRPRPEPPPVPRPRTVRTQLPAICPCGCKKQFDACTCDVAQKIRRQYERSRNEN